MHSPAPARTFFKLMQLEQLARRCVEETVRSEQLTAGQYAVLNLLVGREPDTSADLARRMGMTAQSMGEFIKALEEKGLVERLDDPGNRRVILVRRTVAGRRVLARCEKLVDKAEQAFFSCLSPDELATLRDALTRLRQAQRERRIESA